MSSKVSRVMSYIHSWPAEYSYSYVSSFEGPQPLSHNLSQPPCISVTISKLLFLLLLKNQLKCTDLKCWDSCILIPGVKIPFVIEACVRNHYKMLSLNITFDLSKTLSCVKELA